MGRGAGAVLDRFGLPAAAALAGIAALLRHADHPWRSDAAAFDQGWWRFADQARYLRSALAFAVGNLDSAQHWYLPGYPLLGAPFVRLTPADPFLLPDVLLLMASLWLTAAIAAQLAPGWRRARLVGALAFLATTVLSRTVLDIWVVPWSTTPTAALTLGCLLATLHMLGGPVTVRSWRPLLAVSLTIVGVAAVRPSDAVVLGAVCGGAILIHLIARWPGRGVAVRAVLPASAASAAALAIYAALYAAIWGRAPSPYLAVSAYIGFEWRILPLQWVEIVLSAQPVLPEPGLVARMPWIIPGLAGMAACLASPPGGGRRRLHAVVVVLVAAQMAEYLAYRDLHPPGLWHNGNYHYFKWLFPVFGLYAALLCAVAAGRQRAGLAAAALAVLAAVPWRVELVPAGMGEAAVRTGDTAPIPAGLGVWDAVLIPAEGSAKAIYDGTHSYFYGPDLRLWFGSLARLVAYPVAGGVMLVPVFQPPSGPGRAVFDTGVTVLGGLPERLARTRIVFGVPCVLSTRLFRVPACEVGGW